jgi:hypothetical protein
VADVLTQEEDVVIVLLEPGRLACIDCIREEFVNGTCAAIPRLIVVNDYYSFVRDSRVKVL